MKKLKEVILFGNTILESTKEKYLITSEALTEKLNGFKIIKALTDSNDEQTRLENKVKSIESDIQYVTFIQKELNNIVNFSKGEVNNDYQYGCMYFGNGTLYYSDEFLKYNENDAYEIILNHIIHYTGCLYVIDSSNIRLSYILLAKSICRAEQVDCSSNRFIYENNKDTFSQIIFDIKDNYSEFIIRNRKFMSFIKNNPRSNENQLTYRIVLNNNIIELKNIIIQINSDKIQSISEFGEYIKDSEKNSVFSLTA